MIENLDQNQIIFILTIMAASAVVVGFMAGFFGIGGGLIMVPILFYLFSFVGIEHAFVMHVSYRYIFFNYNSKFNYINNDTYEI